MGTKFEKLHKYGQKLIFNKVHDKLKVVLEDNEGRRFLVNGLLSKYSKNNTLISEDLFDINKLFIKFMVDELNTVLDIKDRKYKLNFNFIKTVILDGIKYNVSKFEINNHTRDFLILEITKFKGN